MNRYKRHILIIVSSVVLLLGSAFGDDSSASSRQSAFGSGSTKAKSRGDSGWFGIGVKTSFLGVGAELATRVTHHTNARAGFNILGYSRNFSKDGINYGGHLSFRTVEAHYDIYPWAGNFHVSPGVLAYMGNPVTANAIVPGNQSFSLGGQTYYSDPSAPVTANGKMNFNQVSPTATIGWGNLVRRNKRFSIPIEIGAAFQGSPKSTLNLTGNVCKVPGILCEHFELNGAEQCRGRASQDQQKLVSVQGLSHHFSWFRIQVLDEAALVKKPRLHNAGGAF
jgi:hypothetical protein